jgi:hypothetical protein
MTSFWRTDVSLSDRDLLEAELLVRGKRRDIHALSARGLRCSIFCGDRQVAAFDKNTVVFGGGNKYDIRMDSDANLMVIVCMVLTINTKDYDDDKQNLLSVDFGNFGHEARAFDEDWEPR